MSLFSCPSWTTAHDRDRSTPPSGVRRRRGSRADAPGLPGPPPRPTAARLKRGGGDPRRDVKGGTGGQNHQKQRQTDRQTNKRREILFHYSKITSSYLLLLLWLGLQTANQRLGRNPHFRQPGGERDQAAASSMKVDWWVSWRLNW